MASLSEAAVKNYSGTNRARKMADRQYLTDEWIECKRNESITKFLAPSDAAAGTAGVPACLRRN